MDPAAVTTGSGLPLPPTATFRRPARANTRVVAAATTAKTEACTATIGFRTHMDNVSGEDFVFSTKTFPIPSLPTIPSRSSNSEAECIIEIVPISAAVPGTPSAWSPSPVVPKSQSAMDFSTAFVTNAALSPLPSSSTSAAVSSLPMEQRRPNGWICRAYCSGEKHALHAAGAISVHQRMMEVKYLSDVAKGKASARVLSFADAQRLYGLSHVELTIQEQFVSRSDMFLICEALRDRVLYLGQEVNYEGFRLKVSDMLREPLGTSQKEFSPQPQQSHVSPVESLRSDFEVVHSGVVTSTSKINFQSLSFVYTVLVELSTEMWLPTLDGRTAYHWAFERFLRELSEQLPRFRSVPSIRLVLFGRLRQEFVLPDGNHDVFHLVTVPKTVVEISRLAEIAKVNCEILLEKLFAQLPGSDRQHPGGLFVASRNSNFLQALNIALEYYNYHHIDRRLDTTGQAITLVSAGHGTYRVTNDVAQITATKLLDIGIRTCHIVCMGRPPLQAAPLFEYCSDDVTLRSQYHLQLDPRARERFYEQPEWASCLFFHPIVSGRPVGAAYRFALLTKEQWEREFPYFTHDQHWYNPGLLIPALPVGDAVLREAPLQAFWRRELGMDASLITYRQEGARDTGAGGVYVRTAEPAVGSLGSTTRLFSTTPGMRQFTVSGAAASQHKNTFRMSASSAFPFRSLHSKKSGAFLGERQPTVAPFIQARWFKQQRTAQSNGIDNNLKIAAPSTGTAPQDTTEFMHIASSNVLDADLCHGGLKLELSVDAMSMYGWMWNPQINLKPDLWQTFINCFGSRTDCVMDLAVGGTAPSNAAKGLKWCAAAHFVPMRTFVCGRTLMLLLQPVPTLTFDIAEELTFSFHPELFVPEPEEGEDQLPAGTSHPILVAQAMRRLNSEDNADLTCGDVMNRLAGRPITGSTVSIGSVQIRSSILFAVQPINPYRAHRDVDQRSSQPCVDAEARRALDVYVTAAQVQQLRWVNAHPTNATASAWVALCKVSILPIFGQKPIYSSDSMRDNGRKQYWIRLSGGGSSALTPLYIKEYLLQRLHQQYQLVSVKHLSQTVEPPVDEISANNSSTNDGDEPGTVATVTTASGSSWSRHIQPLEEIELTIGHQSQIIKIADDRRGVFVQRWLHKGMYESNTTHLVSYSYSILNHTTLTFSPKEVRLEAVLGERFDFCWHELDEYLSTRDGEIPNFLFRDRQVCFVLLPNQSQDEANRELRNQKKRVSFDAFKAFVTSRFSTKLKPREGAQVDDLWKWNTEALRFYDDAIPALGIPVRKTKTADMEESNAQPRSQHMLRAVILEHKKDDPSQCPDVCLRRPVDPSTGRTNHHAFVDDRVMGADIDLSMYYHESCAYVMRLSWLCCAATIIADWTKGLQLNATKYGLMVIPVPCVYDAGACGSILLAQYHAHPPGGVQDTAFREYLLLLLADKYGYFPEVQQMNMFCRLVHGSGLCYVVSLPDRCGVTWSENYVWKSGRPEQYTLLCDFKDAVEEATAHFASSQSKV